jgi:hypothetical protein
MASTTNLHSLTLAKQGLLNPQISLVNNRNHKTSHTACSDPEALIKCPVRLLGRAQINYPTAYLPVKTSINIIRNTNSHSPVYVIYLQTLPHHPESLTNHAVTTRSRPAVHLYHFPVLMVQAIVPARGLAPELPTTTQ